MKLCFQQVLQVKGTKVNENVKLVQGKISGEYNDETDSEPRLWKDHEKGRGDETIRQREEPGCLGTAGGGRGGEAAEEDEDQHGCGTKREHRVAPVQAGAEEVPALHSHMGLTNAIGLHLR